MRAHTHTQSVYIVSVLVLIVCSDKYTTYSFQNHQRIFNWTKPTMLLNPNGLDNDIQRSMDVHEFGHALVLSRDQDHQHSTAEKQDWIYTQSKGLHVR